MNATFTSVLKKIGQTLISAGSVASDVMNIPFIGQLLGRIKVGGPGSTTTIAEVAGDFNTLSSLAVMLETAMPTTGSGSQRLAAGAPLAQQAVLLWAKSNLPGHNTVKDPAKLAAASGRLLGDWADILNSFGE